jgi:hypothetical protein
VKTTHHSTLVGRFTDDESTFYTISTSASVILSYRHGGLVDDCDRAAGDVMSGMPPEYRLWYGHTCILTPKGYACGHTTKATLHRAVDCWRCAQTRSSSCAPATIIEDDASGECCSACKASQPGAPEDDTKKAVAKERETQADRERSAARRRGMRK